LLVDRRIDGNCGMFVKQLSADVRPELVRQSAQATVQQRDASAAESESKPTIALRVVGIGEASGRERPEYVGKRERTPTPISVANEFLS
jgi:hypothetical protein